MSKFKSILLWSLISAAFIGPGTVTTASSAGYNEGYALLWCLAFAILACFMVQEACARLAIHTQLSLPQALLKISKNAPLVRGAIYLTGAVVLIGCIAYQGGNLMGAKAGIQLFFPGMDGIMLTALALLVFLILRRNNFNFASTFLSIVVGIMGLTFLIIVFKSPHNWSEVSQGFVPKITQGNSLLALGLIGTTIVPYNLFLGAGLGKNETIGNMRFGLLISLIIGGLISMAILINGNMVTGTFSFPQIGASLLPYLGSAGPVLFGVGLFAAGFTSAVTAPMAAGLVAKGFSGTESDKVFRFTWMGVLFAGLLFSLLSIKPIPLIIIAQALNGMILPFAIMMVWYCINHPKILGKNTPGLFYNGIFTVVGTLINILGFNGMASQIEKWFQLELSFAYPAFLGATLTFAMIGIIISVRRKSYS